MMVLVAQKEMHTMQIQMCAGVVDSFEADIHPYHSQAADETVLTACNSNGSNSSDTRYAYVRVSVQLTLDETYKLQLLDGKRKHN